MTLTLERSHVRCGTENERIAFLIGCGILGIIVWLYWFYALCVLAFFGLLYLYEKYGKQG